MKVKSPLKSTVSHALLAAVTLAFLYPLIFAVATALKPAGETFSDPGSLVGSSIRWQNFADVFTYVPFQRYILNGVLVAGVGTLVVLTASALSAYAFAALRWRGRDGVFLIFLATLMVPQEVLVVPMFILMQSLGWVDTYQALIFPWAFTAFGTFLLRQFFRSVPREMQEAARIDSAGELRIFTQIMLPMARPALGVLAVFTFINYWNSFLWPLIMINDVSARGTVPLGLQLFFGQNGNQWHLVMAASIVSILPTLLLLIALQKHLVKGIATAGLAGR
ncbi:carbohydrate ABC transporter permease [Nonomuraea sp. NPDC055795]|uniref:Multiple sugar transport system permease protein n=1 Tax=Nonomuraea endophytica TaxID=714136 RepID=A0A7W8A4H9_9ACTN|nr:carbohydrate ABC transporter permease [Nonomuraea endophytica]MBB5078695.1 multiple sugar transport system permease protein [Nonomuraea endophytica]